MDDLFAERCKGLAITRLAVACLRRVLGHAAAHIVEGSMNYDKLKVRLAATLPPSLAGPATDHAKAWIARKRPRPCFPGANISKTANIVLYLVLEYLLLEILDLAQAAASTARHIRPRHVRMAILLDDDLRTLIQEQRTLLFFKDDERVDPLMGSLGSIKMTTHCLSTDFIRKRGECSLRHRDADVRLQMGPFRMYSRLYKDVVVAFVLVSKQGSDLRVDYGFHPKCMGVWKGMVRRLLQRGEAAPNILTSATSTQVGSFLTRAGFVKKKSMFFYNRHEATNHEIRPDCRILAASDLGRDVRGRVRDHLATSRASPPRRAAARKDGPAHLPPRDGEALRSAEHEGHVPSGDDL